MNLGTILIVILILIALGALPQTGWHNLGYGLSGSAVGLVVLIIVILMLAGRL